MHGQGGVPMSQTGQPELFYESFLEALKDDVKAIGGSKELGAKFWPEKAATAEGLVAARNAVNDRLNGDKRDRFNDDQVRYIMRRAREVRGFSAALYFICDDTQFERPKPRAPQDERAEIVRQIREAASMFKAGMERFERLAPVVLAGDEGRQP